MKALVLNPAVAAVFFALVSGAATVLGAQSNSEAAPRIVPTRPPLLLSDHELTGNYKHLPPGETCQDEGRNLCSAARIIRQAGRAWLSLSHGEIELPLSQGNGVLTFSKSFQEDCDNPGCGNLRKISGVVYFKKIGRQWLRAVKLNVDMEFNHPESEEDPQGLVKSSAYLIQE